MIKTVSWLFLFMCLVRMFWAEYSVADFDRADGAQFAPSFEVYSSSSVVSDPDDLVKISSKIGALGEYKYSLDGSLAASNLRGMEIESKKSVVKDLMSGRIGITEGRLIIKYAKGVNGENLAIDYSLDLVEQLPSINRIVVQLSDLTTLKQVQGNLMLDKRVLTTSLEAQYGGYTPR